MTDSLTRRQIELAWEDFWRAGLCDPVAILEQILYLLFLRRLDHDEFDQPRCARPALPMAWGKPLADAESLRWRAVRALSAARQFELLSEHIFPRLRCIGGPGGAYSQHMKDARFLIATPEALSSIMRHLDRLPDARSADCAAPFDYVVDKLSGMGRRCAASTPRSIASLMVALLAPEPDDVICNPVCGDGQLLIAASHYIETHFHAEMKAPILGEHYHHRMFHAYDADKLMLRVMCMKMLLQGIKNPDIRYSNAVAPDLSCMAAQYSIVLAHVGGAYIASDDRTKAGCPQAVVHTVLQIAHMLKPGGRAAVIVPMSIFQGRSSTERSVRRMLLLEQRLDAHIPLILPGDVKARLLLFTRTDCGSKRVALRQSPSVCSAARARASLARHSVNIDDRLVDPIQNFPTGETPCDQSDAHR